MLALGHFVAVGHFEMILSKSTLSFFNFGLLALVLTTVHDLLGTKLINLLLAKLSLNLSFFSALIGVGFVDFGLTGLANSGAISLSFLLGTLVSVATLVHVVEHLVLA